LFFTQQLEEQVLAHETGIFSCEVIPNRDAAIVAPRGELDMATIGAVEEGLRHLRRQGFDKLVLDLRELTFMDSTGLHLVTRWSKASSTDGFTFEIVPGPRVVQRVFELAEMTHGLPFREPG
jgi:anti-sigma B factor antagonist